jgi:hypothetical protein
MCVEMTLGIQKVVKLEIGEAYKEGDKSWRIKKISFQTKQHKTKKNSWDKLKKTHINIVHNIFVSLGFQHDLLVLQYLAIGKNKTSCFLACLVSFHEHDDAKHKIYNR